MINIESRAAYNNAPKLIKEFWDKFPEKTEYEIVELLSKLWFQPPTNADKLWAADVIKSHINKKIK